MTVVVVGAAEKKGRQKVRPFSIGLAVCEASAADVKASSCGLSVKTALAPAVDQRGR
jgi:hypothetical protein